MTGHFFQNAAHVNMDKPSFNAIQGNQTTNHYGNVTHVSGSHNKTTTNNYNSNNVYGSANANVPRNQGRRNPERGGGFAPGDRPSTAPPTMEGDSDSDDSPERTAEEWEDYAAHQRYKARAKERAWKSRMAPNGGENSPRNPPHNSGPYPPPPYPQQQQQQQPYPPYHQQPYPPPPQQPHFYQPPPPPHSQSYPSHDARYPTPHQGGGGGGYYPDGSFGQHPPPPQPAPGVNPYSRSPRPPQRPPPRDEQYDGYLPNGNGNVDGAAGARGSASPPPPPLQSPWDNGQTRYRPQHEPYGYPGGYNYGRGGGGGYPHQQREPYGPGPEYAAPPYHEAREPYARRSLNPMMGPNPNPNSSNVDSSENDYPPPHDPRQRSNPDESVGGYNYGGGGGGYYGASQTSPPPPPPPPPPSVVSDGGGASGGDASSRFGEAQREPNADARVDRNPFRKRNKLGGGNAGPMPMSFSSAGENTSGRRTPSGGGGAAPYSTLDQSGGGR